MKHTCMKSCAAALAIVTLMALAGCDNTLTDQGGGGTRGGTGGGTVEIQIGTPEARTVHPALVFTKYVLSFTGPGSETHEPVALTDGDGSTTIELTVGQWTITATAYTGTGEDAQATARGSVDVAVLETEPVQAYIILGPIPGAETGTFSYAITLPADASAATLSLTDAATDTAVPGSPIDLTGAGGSGTLDLAPGSYLMQIQLTKAGGETTGLAEAVHIYAGLTTSAAGADYDFTAIHLADLASHLSSLPTGTAEAPNTVVLAASVVIDTADTNANGVWATINSTVQTAGKYVLLDLSACSAVGNTIAGGNSLTNNHFNIIGSNQYIKGITLPSTLTSIGDYAFIYCGGLTSVTIPDSVTSFGNGSFYACSGLTSLTIPVGVTSIGSGSFYAFYAAIEVAAGNTAYSTEDGILYNNDKTTVLRVLRTKSGALNLPNTLTCIGDYAVEGCSGLTSVTIPDSVTSIEYYAFGGCSGLTSVTIPDGVTNIGSNAFIDCSGLTSVTIPDSVTSIREYAFLYCYGLTSVTIGNGVTSIGGGAFSYCSSLTAFTVAAGNTAYSAQDGILYNKAKTAIIGVPGAISGALNLPSTLTSIGHSAFMGCSGLTGVTIPGSVTSIDVQAFRGCSGLTSVTIPAGVTSIGGSAFGSCSGLTSVTFEAGSNITTAWDGGSFPDSNYGDTGDSLWAAYTGGASKAGTYTRSGNEWTQVE